MDTNGLLLNSYDIIDDPCSTDVTGKKELWKGRDLNPLPPGCHARTLPAGAVMIATCSTPELYGLSIGSRMIHSSTR